MTFFLPPTAPATLPHISPISPNSQVNNFFFFDFVLSHTCVCVRARACKYIKIQLFEFLFFAFVYMVSGLTTLHWTTNWGTSPWETFTLLPAVTIACI